MKRFARQKSDKNCMPELTYINHAHMSNNKCYLLYC